MTRAWYGVLLGALVLASVGLAGCGGKPKPHTLLLLVFDETTSFVEAGHWDASVQMARIAVDHLAPGDAVGAVGIDHHGFDTADIRLPVTMLSRATMQAVTDRKAVKAQLSALQPRETSSGYRLSTGKTRGTPLGTDTLGALDQAAQMADYYPQMRVRVLLFSDLRNEPITGPSGYSGVQHLFSGDCQAMSLFVDESGGGEWKARIARWTKALNALGLSCHETQFHAPGMSSPSALGMVIQKWLHK
jgi:hypothetical protein